MHNFLHTYGKRIGSVTLGLVSGLLATAMLLSLLGAAPVATGTVVSSTSVALLQARNITSTADAQATGASTLTGGYGIADCYSNVTALNFQTATVKLQHSYNGGFWVDLLTFPSETTTTVDFTQTALFGNNTRAIVTSMLTTNPISISVLCVLKNTR